MMTRNDFEILARHLRAMRPDIPTMEDQPETEVILYPEELDGPVYKIGYLDGYRAAVDQVMGAASSVNPRFNGKTFLRACGYDV